MKHVTPGSHQPTAPAPVLAPLISSPHNSGTAASLSVQWHPISVRPTAPSLHPFLPPASSLTLLFPGHKEMVTSPQILRLGRLQNTEMVYKANRTTPQSEGPAPALPLWLDQVAELQRARAWLPASLLTSVPCPCFRSMGNRTCREQMGPLKTLCRRWGSGQAAGTLEDKGRALFFLEVTDASKLKSIFSLLRKHIWLGKKMKAED